MASGKKTTVISSLADYVDSDQDSDSEADETGVVGGLVSSVYNEEEDVSRIEDEDERGSVNEDSDDSSRNSDKEDSDTGGDADGSQDISELEKRDPNELVAMFSEKVRNMSPDDIKIPPEPPGRCSSTLQEKIKKLYLRKLCEDFDTNSHIQKRKDFRNPSIYEKLIQFCGIDELGTNYPKDMFDPHGWSEDSYYEALAKAQKVEMDKLEKAKKEKTKIEFVTGTKKGTANIPPPTTANTTTTSTEAHKRKSKWDSAVPVTLAQPALITTTATLPGVVSVTTTASGTKTTVISAVGTILKKAKQ